MKRMIYLFLLAPFYLLSGCSDDIETENEMLPESNPQVEMKAMVSPIIGTTSKSNPNLYSNWENQSVINLNGGGSIDAPWVFAMGNSMEIPFSVRTDIKKEDGWTMLGHTLSDSKSLEPNYILFYHKQSGILKGFYYNRAPAPNANAKWVIHADQPSSIIPSSSWEHHLFNIAKQYGITSNVIKSDFVSSIGALVAGWNCFSFELPYGTIHSSKPIIDIKGYSVSDYELKANGKLSGQVVVPSASTTNKLGELKSFFGTVSNFTGAINTFSGLFKKPEKKSAEAAINESNMNTKSVIGVITIVSSAVSIASNIIGGASAFTSKAENVTQRYNFSGNINMTGSVVANLGGHVASINDIDINKLNNGQPLGVWGLKELPTMKINKYGEAILFSQIYSDPDISVVTRNVDLNRQIKKESVLINPSLLPLIESYNVRVGDISCSENGKGIEGCNYKYVAPGLHLGLIIWDQIEYTRKFSKNHLSINPNYDYKYILGYMTDQYTVPETYANIIVNITYKDGTTLASSRVFRIKAELYDNSREIKAAFPNKRLIFINAQNSALWEHM